MFSLVATAALCLQAPPQRTFHHIDLYGLRTVDVRLVHEALAVTPGEPLDYDRDAARERLLAIDGIADAKLIQMMIPGNEILLVGIEEDDAPRLELRPAPSGDARLPESFVTLYDAIMELGYEGIVKGMSSEDRDEGYSLSQYPPAREKEIELRTLALEHAELLPRVLLESADAKHRTVAARAVAFLPDKPAVVRWLAPGVVDPDSAVRNNATRALLVLADWAGERDDFAIELDPQPFLDMLESLEWTDRNKASGLLYHLTKARDPELLARLRAQSIPALEEMARWHGGGYSFGPATMLGRLAGVPDDEVRARHQDTAADEEQRAAWIDELVERARARGANEPSVRGREDEDA